jgi:hypothetical protein
VGNIMQYLPPGGPQHPADEEAGGEDAAAAPVAVVICGNCPDVETLLENPTNPSHQHTA